MQQKSITVQPLTECALRDRVETYVKFFCSIGNLEHRLVRSQKMLSDYQAQIDKPFDGEDRLEELLERQTELNAALDLDKSDTQAATFIDAHGTIDEEDHNKLEEKTTYNKDMEQGHKTNRHDYDDHYDEDSPDTEIDRNSVVYRRSAPSMEPGF